MPEYLIYDQTLQKLMILSHNTEQPQFRSYWQTWGAVAAGLIDDHEQGKTTEAEMISEANREAESYLEYLASLVPIEQRPITYREAPESVWE
jgi:type II secretory pathway predicted ATPase ExeA